MESKGVEREGVKGLANDEEKEIKKGNRSSYKGYAKRRKRQTRESLEKSFYITEHDEIHIVRLENWRTPIFRTAIKLF